MNQEANDSWVLLYTAADMVEGSIVLGLLREAGILAISRPHGHIYLQWSSPVDILVPGDQVEQARWEIAKAKQRGELGRGDNGHDEW